MIDGVELKEKPKLIRWSVVIFDLQFIVDAKDSQEARKEAAHLYRRKTKSVYPIAFLQSAGRVRRHEDKRIKFNFGNVPDLLALEKQRREFLVAAEEEEEKEYGPAEGRTLPKYAKR